MSTCDMGDEISSLFEAYRIPRGGAIGSGKKKSVYVKALGDEILWLEQQLRRVEEEKRILRKKFRRRQQIRDDIMQNKDRKTKSGSKDNDKVTLDEQEEGLLRLASIEQLEKQKEKLLKAKDQLESIKLDYEQKLQVLQADLSKSKSRKDNLEKIFLTRVKELEKSLQKVRDTTADPKLYEDADLSRKIDEACQAAIADFWIEGNRRLQEHERELKARYKQELLEERRLANLAVMKQREKMRALARATAIREKEVAAKAKEISRRISQERRTQPNKNSPPKSPAYKKRNEKSERDQLKAIREEAERKAKEEEQRMLLELERELEQERERVHRMNQRREEEKRRCEQEELERKRLLQQHALDMEERLRQEQIKAAADDSGRKGGKGSSLFRKLLGSHSKKQKTATISKPITSSIENYQRRVLWQPVSLPPKELVQITGPNKNE